MNEIDERSLSLRDLILTMKGDRTYAGLEAASHGIVKAQRWQVVANGLKPLHEFPEPRTLAAMAEALDVEVEVVLMAFARALGLDVGGERSTFATLLPPSADRLTDRQQAAVLAVIRAMGDRGEVTQDEGYYVASNSANPGLPAPE